MTAAPPLFAAEERMWKAGDVARFLDCSRSWVYARAEAGELPCLRLRGLLRFDPETVRKFARGELANTGRVIALATRGR